LACFACDTDSIRQLMRIHWNRKPVSRRTPEFSRNNDLWTTRGVGYLPTIRTRLKDFVKSFPNFALTFL
jgi:hypothetical protein